MGQEGLPGAAEGPRGGKALGGHPLLLPRLEGDPLENWRLHDLDIKARAEALNAMGLTALEYRDPNGTELRVGSSRRPSSSAERSAAR